MSNNKSGWLMNAMAFVCLVAGNTEVGMTCLCTAIILFSIKK